MYFLWYLLIGLAAGWIASLIFKGSGSGLLVNLIVGLVGGILGGWLVSLFGWVPTGTWGTFLSSVIDAIVLLWIVSLFIRHKTVKTMELWKSIRQKRTKRIGNTPKKQSTRRKNTAKRPGTICRKTCRS